MKGSLIIFALLWSLSMAVKTSKKRICFYANWAQFRKGPAKFMPKDIDVDLCTHITYAHLKIDLESHKLVQRQKNDAKLLMKLSKLKLVKPSLKIIISVGGWKHEEQPRFSKMVQNEKTRATFIKSAIQYMKLSKVDGLSIDWEYPTHRGTSGPEDKRKYTLLLKEIREAFNKEKLPYTLSASVSAGRKIINKAYEHTEIAKYVDWVNVMAYALHGAWEKKTGHHTSMTGVPNVLDSLLAWQETGFPDEKINIGVATYGRSFTLKNPKQYGLGAPVASPAHGTPGKYTRGKGILSMYEICAMNFDHSTSFKSSKALKPYASEGDQWVGYETPASMRFAVSTIFKKNCNLNGIAIWTMGYDDLTGTFCDQGKYPLIRAAITGLESSKC